MHGTLAQPRPAWLPDWSNDVVALVASGESAKAAPLELLRGRARVAVVNNCHELAPWADLLYAADQRWWDVNRGARQFAGLRVIPVSTNRDEEEEIRSVTLAAQRYGLHTVRLLDTPKDDDNPSAHRLALDHDGTISRGGNSAFQLVNLVAQCRCKRQLWIGFDFTGEHWHDKHPPPLKNPRPTTLTKWAKRLDAQAQQLKAFGIGVVNCSTVSALQAYPKMTLPEALARWA